MNEYLEELSEIEYDRYLREQEERAREEEYHARAREEAERIYQQNNIKHFGKKGFSIGSASTKGFAGIQDLSEEIKAYTNADEEERRKLEDKAIERQRELERIQRKKTEIAKKVGEMLLGEPGTFFSVHNEPSDEKKEEIDNIIEETENKEKSLEQRILEA